MHNMAYHMLSQVLNTKKFLPLSGVIENLSDTDRKVMNIVLYLTGKFQSVWARQQTIARYANISREWCNRILKKLGSLGLLSMTNRGYNGFLQMGRTCLYKVADFFGSEQTRFSLMKYFPALRQQSLIHFTQYIYNLSLIKHMLMLDSHSTKREEDSVRDMLCNFSKKGEKVTNLNNEISQSIKNITFLDLTFEGQVQLSSFSDIAINHVNTRLMRNPKAQFTNPFGYFFKLCKSYSEEQNLPVDTQRLFALKRHYKIDSEKPMYNAKIIAQASPSASKKQNEKFEQEYAAMVYERTCAEVARELEKIRQHKKTEVYERACKLPGFREYTSLVEYNIASSAKCDKTCAYCKSANEVGF